MRPTNKSKSNLTKFIFGQIAEIQGISEIEVYTNFVNNIHDSRLDINILTDDYIEEFYGKNGETPRFFDYKNHRNWSALNNAVMRENECLAFYQVKNNEFYKIYDDSVGTKLGFPKINLLKHIFLLSKESRGDEQITYVTNYTAPWIFPFESEKNFLAASEAKGKKYLVKGKLLGQTLNELLETEADGPTNLPDDYNFDQLTDDISIFSHVPRPILITSHSGSKITWKYKNTNNKMVCNYFANLCSYNDRKEGEPIVICLTLDQDGETLIAYFPTELMKSEIMKQMIKPPGRNPSIKELLKYSASKARGKKAKAKQEKEDERDKYLDEWWSDHSKKCQCYCCQLAKNDYSNNVAVDGPQPIVHINLDTIEYLKFFNLFNESNLKNLQRVYDLSIAALDIESFSRQMTQDFQNIQNISKFGRGRVVKSIQEIALIGYGDHFNQNDMAYYKLFKVNKKESAKDVVGQMVEHIYERNEIIKLEKRELLKPFFSFINQYRTAHNTFWKEEFKRHYKEGDKMYSVIAKSFQHSLIGKFEQHLTKLESNIFVYTFNGGRYDLVLLHKFIASHMKKNGLSLNIIKKNSRIQKITLKGGVMFVDICDLIGGGNSLATFSKLTGQEETKMIFPFQCFNNIDFLNSTSLPIDQEEWFNDLKNEPTSLEDIKRAHDDYRHLGVNTVGEYLEAYLKSKYTVYLY